MAKNKLAILSFYRSYLKWLSAHFRIDSITDAVVKIQVKVKPNARISSLVQLDDGTWFAQLKSPPVDGRANAELCLLIAERFDVMRTRVVVKSGATGRMKWIEIIDI